ncbi:MAG: hypothetical protein J6Y54_09365 [Lentisphaeria bacterium]|nr:hypothetical protein [Lentisphaeria bacterium]
MTLAAFFLIFASAGLHASWNLIAKKSRMNLAFYATIVLVDMLMGAWIWFRLPLALSDLTPKFYLVTAGSALGETCYCIGLIMAYRKMDMSAAYPMMRSLPLIFTALLTMICGVGKPLSGLAMVGMATVFAGCMVMPLNKFSDFRLSNYLDRKIAFVLMAALGTTVYTICDSEAQRVMGACAPKLSETMITCTYYEFRHVAVFLSVGTLTLALPFARAEVAELRLRGWGAAALAGVFAGLTYYLVLLAMNPKFVSHVSYVQAFRQRGLVIGMLEGIFILKERCTLTRVIGIVLIVSGLVMTVIK